MNKITHAHYVDLIQIFGELGGIVSFIKGVTFILTAYWLRLNWYNSIFNDIQKVDIYNRDTQTIKSQIKQRVSFKGIYKLHDHVNYIYDQVQNTKYKSD